MIHDITLFEERIGMITDHPAKYTHRSLDKY